MAERVPPRRAALGAALRQLRARHYRSGSALARELDWTQTRVSKLERGTQLPSQDDIEAWLSATRATAEQAAELQELLAGARLARRVWRRTWSVPGAIEATQDEILVEDQRAIRLAEYQPSMIPGLVQTPGYARGVLSAPAGPGLVGATSKEIERKIAGQVRRQEVLYQPGKQIQLVIGEAALRVRFGDDRTMSGQLDRLITVSGLSGVVFGVLPFDRLSPMLPLAGFALNDSRVVWVETLTGEQRLDDPDEVAAYVAAFETALSAAVVGDDAVALIRSLG